MNQRQTRDRPGHEARACDVDDARHQHEMLAARLQAPADLLDLVGGQVVGAGDRHRVGTARPHRLLDGVDAAHDRNLGAVDRVGYATRGHTRTDHVIAGARVAVQLAGDRGDRLLGADQQYPDDPLAVRPLGDEPLAPQPPTEAQHGQPEREGDQQIAARDIDAKEERENRDAAEQAHAQSDDALVLGCAGADHPVAAGVEGRQEQHPHHNQTR